MPAPTGRSPPRPRGGPPDVRLLGGYFVFDSPDAALLVSLLPPLLHVRGVERLSTLVRLVGEEADEPRPGRDLVLTRLVEVLLIEALRSTQADDAPPGLLRGLADPRLAAAIRQMHGDPARAWTVAAAGGDGRALALGLLRPLHARGRPAADGVPPRLAHGARQDLLRRNDLGLAEIAERVGYGSASAFSTAFSRHVGQSAESICAPAIDRHVEVTSAVAPVSWKAHTSTSQYCMDSIRNQTRSFADVRTLRHTR